MEVNNYTHARTHTHKHTQLHSLVGVRPRTLPHSHLVPTKRVCINTERKHALKNTQFRSHSKSILGAYYQSRAGCRGRPLPPCLSSGRSYQLRGRDTLGPISLKEESLSNQVSSMSGLGTFQRTPSKPHFILEAFFIWSPHLN